MNLSSPLVRFLLKAVALYLGWNLLWSVWLEKDRTIDHYLTYNTASISAATLNFFSNSEFKISPFHEQNTFLFKDGIPVVLIEHGCNGLILMVLFSIFIIAFPGPYKAKLWYIPLGIFCIYLINSLRVVGLAVNKIHFNSSFEFNHKFTFIILVYGAIFGFWMYWVNRFSGINAAKKSR